MPLDPEVLRRRSGRAPRQPAAWPEVDRIAWSASAERRHWSDDTEWWTSPSMSFVKGLEDGVRQGRDQAYREIFDGLFESLRTSGGLRDVAFREAMDRAIKDIEADARRRAWDATAGIPRAEDFKGGGAA